MSVLLCGRTRTTEYLFTMKRFYSLFLILCMAIGFADIAVAQENQDSPAQKTRYVYLWDVTGSINKGLYNTMFDFLKKDIVGKQSIEDTEIYVVPFNDKVVSSGNGNMIFGFKVENGQIVTKRGGKSISELKDYGWTSVDEHLKAFRESEKEGVFKGGYTDIASAVYFARDEYLNPEYNTIFILLTDGGQEYYNDKDYVRGGNEDSKTRLQQSILDLDGKMRGYSSGINMMFYVLFKGDNKAPYKNAENFMSQLSNTKFIEADKSTPTIHFCPITASIVANKKGVISCRDDRFGVSFSKPDGFAWPNNFNITFTCGDNVNQTSTLQSSSIQIKCNSKFSVPKQQTICVPITLSTPKRWIIEERGSTYYVYWLATTKLDLKVTNDFSPTVRVKLK